MADTNDQPMTDVNSPATTNNSDDPSTYLSSLSEPLKSYAIKAFSPTSEDTTADNGDDTTTNKRLDELEISTRSHLLTLVEQLHSITNNQDDEQAISSAIETILDYLNSVTLLCLHVTRNHSTTTTSTTTASQYYKHLTNISIIKKLPFLLLEDTIDSLPLQHIQTIWSSPSYSSKTISSLTSQNKLTSPLIFTPPSKLILLRICNKILKLLSSNNNCEFAGTIMILLTKVFPLSERSAINVLGSFNVRNETVFEDEVEYNEKINQQGNAGDCENNKGSSNIGYDFYKTFWSVQHIFTDPTTTILYSKNNGLSQSDAANAYNCFMKDITSILVALEGSCIPVSKSSTEENTSTLTNIIEEDTTTATTARHHKYLTSSQLLHLQLKDVNLRIHFLTQLLIILSYLSSPTVILPTGVASTAGSNTEKLASQIKVAQMKQLSLIEKRAMGLLSSTTPPVGENMLKCLKWILKEREIIWRNWKRFKCNPALDKVGGVSGSSGLDVKNKFLVGKKRKAAAALEEEKSKDKKKDDDAIQITDLARDTTSQDQDISSSLPPTLKTFLEPYTDALDPENGIEGEYHPRNDSVYSWRALRLMARDQNDSGQLNKFDKIRRKDGDFEGMVRDMAKEKDDEIGGTLPEDYYAEEPDDEKKQDVDMDDASVGTPEEETIAKKEQMEEFERAAMECEDDLLNDKEDDGKEKGVEVKSGEKAEPSKREDNGVKKEEKDDKSKEKGNTATETASSKLNGQEKKKDEPKKSNVPEKKKEDAKKNESRKKKSPEKKDDDKKKKDEPKKGKEDNSKAKDNGRSKRGGGKSQSNEKDTKKDSKKDTKVDSNGKKTGRAKFTPPEGDKSKQKDEAIRNSSSRGRQSGNRRGSERNERQQQQQQQPDRNDHGHRRDNSTDGRRSQIPAPSHNRSQSRDGRDNHRGNSNNDIGRDTSRGRDAKSRSPPNDGGGRNAPRSAPQGGWQPPPQGRGASQGRGAPQRGGRGGGRGRGSRR